MRRSRVAPASARWPALVACLGLATAPTSSRASDFFGPQRAFQIQPEIDLYDSVTGNMRLILQVQSALIPAQSYAGGYVGGFMDWSLAALGRRLLSADLAKTHALNIRFGASYSNTIDPGSVGSSEYVSLQLDVTPRYFLPWEILATNRHRVTTRWNLLASDALSWRFRDRLRFEREFNLKELALTPFVDVEFIWQSPPAMWSQFRMEAGVQCPFEVGDLKQTLEVNFTALTYLQPTRTWRPVLGLIWSFFV
ncbi:MAG TPA: hypothetical protein VMK12_20815 [Anaeromyxobacteraceae bacterium]|nr:hypothetical protein [Anaeromyxobacteraceae bacterium]